MRKLLIIIVLLILTVCSCTTTRLVEVPVETVKTEYKFNTRVDSIFERDSIDRWIAGDTVFIYKEHTKYKYKEKVDTVIQRDTIPKIIKLETVKEVEVNHIKWYQKSLIWLGFIGLLFLIAFGTFKLTKLKLL